MAVYLLAAAVNYDATIFDSNDLSVIRGSSFAVLRFGDDLHNYLQAQLGATADIEPLYSGASELVLRFSSKRPAAPPTVKIEAPFGSKQKWRDTTLPGLVAQVNAGQTAESVAQEWVTANARQIRDADRAKKAIVRQINFLQAEQAADAAAASVPTIDETAVDTAVEAFFAAPTPAKLKYFTFAHACRTTAKEHRLADILAVLSSRLRTRQLQALTVALPPSVATLQSAEEAFCALTLWRHPAAPGEKDKDRPVSASARARRREGRDRKQDFYLDQIRRSAQAARDMTPADTGGAAMLEAAATALESRPFVFANDFEAMVDNPPEGLPPNVKGKLAVIFIDGNGFTKKRETCAELPGLDDAFTAYRRFCLALERNGGLILAGLLQWMLTQPDEFCHGTGDDRYLRFETLLFGGDDICFVVPAWGGFAFMGKLQEILAGLRAPVAGQYETPVTYKAGMVFADHKSPIRDLRRVAESLAYAAKATSGDRNIVQVMALEGLDRADLDPQRLRGELFGENVRKDPGAFGLEGSQWEKIRETVQAIRKKTGRSQLHKWYAKAEEKGILKLLGDDPKTDVLKTKEFIERTQDFIDKFDDRLGELDVDEGLCKVLAGEDPLLASGAARWPLLPLHHVLTLADYIEAMRLTDQPHAGGAGS